MVSDGFSPKELMVMYTCLDVQVKNNIIRINDGDFADSSREELLAVNAVCNSAKRKLKKLLAAAGIDTKELV